MRKEVLMSIVPDTRKLRVYVVPTFDYVNDAGETNVVAIFNMKDHTMPRAWDYEEGKLNMFGGGLDPEDEGSHWRGLMREMEEEAPYLKSLAESNNAEYVCIWDEAGVKVYTVNIGRIDSKQWRSILKTCTEGIPVTVSGVRYNGLRNGRPMDRSDFATDLAFHISREVLDKVQSLPTGNEW